MKNTRNLTILIIVIVLIIGGLVYMRRESSSPVVTDTATESSSVSTSTASHSSEPSFSVQNQTKASAQNAVTSIAPDSTWKNFEEPQYKYGFEYPENWQISVQYVHPAQITPEQIVLVNGGYVISFFVSKNAVPDDTISSSGVASIGTLNGQTLYRYAKPTYDAGGKNGWFAVLEKNTNGIGYTKSIPYGNYYYSIYYYLPSNTTSTDGYDEKLINEADKIVSTFHFN